MVSTTRTEAMEDVRSIRSEAMDKFYRLKKLREAGKTDKIDLTIEHNENEALAIALKAACTEIAKDNLTISQGYLTQKVIETESKMKRLAD